ncbi:hemoglobin subunit alpha-1-like [Thalassophryne amazonica]|uniref:hemoglobin subunit alpha-1-like n=1 Tax=Thalassophryne amazonica TaxID=390379 RepID=UPI0014714251|nr:hemoglobin subunit alpha-1-like [Thalassophryne amazonica]XP_034046303.1 hemoglobin subunit alpha-1-like [Thalassophryne amazonica]
MSLNATDKEVINKFWKKASNRVDEIGADALGRMLMVYPQTKTYFSHWKDLSPTSKSVREHGKLIMAGVADAVIKMNDLTNGLLYLSELHAYNLRVDPANFKILSHCIMVVLAIMFPTDFTPEVHVSFDKFMVAVALALSEKYR